MFPINIANVADYKEDGIGSKILVFGARNDTNTPHTITSGEAGSWLFDVVTNEAAAGGELMTNWNKNSGFVFKIDKDVLPKTIQRGYCLMVWNAYVNTSVNSGNRFVRPFFLKRSDNSRIYENLTIQSSSDASKRTDLSGSCIVPLVWDTDGYCTPALGFNLREGDEITSASFACVVFNMS